MQEAGCWMLEMQTDSSIPTANSPFSVRAGRASTPSDSGPSGASSQDR